MVSLLFVVSVYFTGGMTRGLSLTSITPVILEMYHTVCPSMELSPLIISLGCAMVMLGSTLVGFVSIRIVSWLGRKRTMVAAGGVVLLMCVLGMFPVHLLYFMVTRLFVGMGTSLIMQNVPLVLSEQVEPKSRGVIASLMNAFIAMGVFVGYILQLWIRSYFNDALVWMTQVTGAAFSIGFFVCSFFIRDIGLQVQQEGLLKVENGATAGAQPSQQPQNSASPPKLKRPSIRDVRFRKCYAIAISLGLQIPATAQNSILQFASNIFKHVFDTPLSGCIGQVIISGFQFVSACIGLIFVRLIKRRTLFAIGMNTNVVAVLCYLIYNFLKLDNSTKQQLFIATVSVACFVSQLTTSALTLAMASEIFPTDYKSVFMNLMVLSMQFGFICTQIVFPIIPEWISYTASLVMMVICDVILMLYLPETYGRSLQDIQDQLIRRQSMRSRRSSAKMEAAIAIEMAQVTQGQPVKDPADGMLE